MTDKNELKCSVYLNAPRLFSGYDEISNSAISLYDELAKKYRSIEMILGNHKINVNVCWRSIQMYFDENILWEGMSPQEKVKYYEEIQKKGGNNIPEINITINDVSEKFGCSEFEYILIHLSFLINLASCGALNLYASEYNLPNKEKIKFYKTTDLFEKSWITSLNLEIGLINKIPFSKVFGWYESLKICDKQISFSAASKAVFSIMRANEMQRAFETSCWLLNALDALYGVSALREPEELIKRIKSNFSKSITNKKNFNKMLTVIERYIKELFSEKFNSYDISYMEDFDDNLIDCEAENYRKADMLGVIAIATLQKKITEFEN